MCSPAWLSIVLAPVTPCLTNVALHCEGWGGVVTFRCPVLLRCADPLCWSLLKSLCAPPPFFCSGQVVKAPKNRDSKPNQVSDLAVTPGSTLPQAPYNIAICINGLQSWVKIDTYPTSMCILLSERQLDLDIFRV